MSINVRFEGGNDRHFEGMKEDREKGQRAYKAYLMEKGENNRERK